MSDQLTWHTPIPKEEMGVTGAGPILRSRALTPAAKFVAVAAKDASGVKDPRSIEVLANQYGFPLDQFRTCLSQLSDIFSLVHVKHPIPEAPEYVVVEVPDELTYHHLLMLWVSGFVDGRTGVNLSCLMARDPMFHYWSHPYRDPAADPWTYIQDYLDDMSPDRDRRKKPRMKARWEADEKARRDAARWQGRNQ